MRKKRKQARAAKGVCCCSSVRFVVNVLEHSGFSVDGIHVDTAGCHHIDARPIDPLGKFRENLQKELERMGYPS